MNILYQTKTFLFYKLFALFSAKITFLTISQKGLDEKFYFFREMKATYM